MEERDDIDFILTLNGHGWSSFYLFTKDSNIKVSITHIFTNPYAELMQALSGLVIGNNSATFTWYDEPGGQKWDIQRIVTAQHKVVVTITEFSELFSGKPQSFKPIFTFEMKLKQLLTIFYLQLQKTFYLLQDKEFAATRKDDFPIHDFGIFDKLVRPFLNH